MRPLVFTGLGVGFILMGAALYALTLRKPKPTPSMPNKSQLREQATLAEETRKMRLASAITAGFGAVLILLTFI
ncbi:MAG: hypothetical protein ACREH8_24360 [Opitutaceae bacterium]